MAEAVVSMALESLRDQLVKEFKFLSEVSNEVKELEAEFVQMQCFLRDASKRQHESQLIKNLVSEIRKLAYRAEDVLDQYAVEVASKRSPNGCGFGKAVKRCSTIFQEGVSVHQIGKEITRIKSDLERISKSLQSYGIQQDQALLGSVLTNEIRHRQTYGHQVEEDFVGMEDDIEKITGFLLDDEDEVISLCGMGGLGKTTLAQKVYNDEKIRHVFESFAWVCVTQECKARVVLGEILRQILPGDQKDRIKGMEENELVEDVHKMLKTRKCLVVLDDIWKLDDWELLKPAFPLTSVNEEVIKSKFFITTRNEKVTGGVGVIHRLDVLRENDAWTLLKSKAFGGQRSSDLRIQPEMEALGKEIVHECGYLPLAISIIGGVLNRSTNDLTGWQRVRKDLDSNLKRGEGIEENKRIQQVLDLSYYDLPHYLKPCFLYIGCAFREDQDTSVKKLYRLWIGEGMVLLEHQGREETLMDVAERYLNELVYRNLVGVKEINELEPQKRYKSCRLHDLVRDLCLDKATDEDFRVMFMEGKPGKSWFLDSSLDGIRRLNIHSDEKEIRELGDEFVSRLNEIGTQLRSLSLFVPFDLDSYFLGRTVWIDVKHFKLLKVLVLEWFDFRGRKRRKTLKDIFNKLVNLRYLSFRHSSMEELPRSITNLTNLVILDLRLGIFEEVAIRNVVWKMTKLKQLYLPDYFLEPNERIELVGLDKVEVLHGLDSRLLDISSIISQLKNLRILVATVVNDYKALMALINEVENMRHLQSMKLTVKDFDLRSEQGSFHLEQMLTSCPTLHKLVLWRCQISEFPKCVDRYSQSLTSLELQICQSENDPMEMLGKFPNLRTVALFACDTKRMVCRAFGFPELRKLELCNLYHLETWTIEEDSDGSCKSCSMPKLCSLRIASCDKLGMVPDGLKFITTLKSMVTEDMPKEFNKRIAEGGEDFHKVSHVPSIYIGPDYEELMSSTE